MSAAETSPEPPGRPPLGPAAGPNAGRADVRPARPAPDPAARPSGGPADQPTGGPGARAAAASAGESGAGSGGPGARPTTGSGAGTATGATAGAGIPTDPSADEAGGGPALEIIQRELTAFARRARAAAARMHPELSLVAYTILAHLEEQQGCRATDLAAHYLLDKSTVSRQVAALERLGFIERRIDPADHRVQVLHLAPRGIEILAAARVRRQESFKVRLAAWDPADLTRFADYLVRYNADATAQP